MWFLREWGAASQAVVSGMFLCSAGRHQGGEGGFGSIPCCTYDGYSRQSRNHQLFFKAGTVWSQSRNELTNNGKEGIEVGQNVRMDNDLGLQ